MIRGHQQTTSFGINMFYLCLKWREKEGGHRGKKGEFVKVCEEEERTRGGKIQYLGLN